ncbi:MAG: zinc dependent phospholipase C family protein [Desulfosporosinus sp.]|nr:zinc dependent phospholipase C family protein [Desulfosporosinus sp.]
MNILMHVELSRVIRKAVEKELNLKIDNFSFTYGNIKPDIIPSSLPHYKESALESVQAEIEQLATLKFNHSSRWLKQFSERLGIITHYLSDFFCYAHSEYFQPEKTGHYLYEFRQFYYFKRNQEVISLYSSMIPTYIQLSASNLHNCIEAAHARYRSIIKDNRVPYARDAIYAISICVLVCVSLISMCLENQLKFAV